MEKSVSYRIVTTNVATDVDTNDVRIEFEVVKKTCDAITSSKVGIDVIVFMKKIRPSDVENAEKRISAMTATTGHCPYTRIILANIDEYAMYKYTHNNHL
jgi:hypothetical protein